MPLGTNGLGFTRPTLSYSKSGFLVSVSYFNPYIVYDVRTGREVCQCSSIQDTLMMIAFDPDHRKYKQRKLVMDQVIDVLSEKLPDDLRLEPQLVLNESTAVPFRG